MATTQRQHACPICESDQGLLVRAREAIAGDLEETKAAGHRLMHSVATDVYACERCDSLFRDPGAVPADLVARYRDDEYGERELVRLHRAGRAACARDREWLGANGLTWGSHVLEVGSYAGGLLAVARLAGCRALGVDVGREVGEFTRGLGFDVITGELASGMVRARSLDAIFALNCLEQMPTPKAQLAQLRCLLRRGGALVVRTPNAHFVRAAHRPGRRALASRSGVLGMPFVRCWSVRTLLGMMREEHFDPVAVRGGEAPWFEVAARAA